MPSLNDMPELVMEQIIGSSDFKAVLTLRQVCRDFRNFIDDLNDSKLPDSNFTKMEIRAEKAGNKIILDIVNSDNGSHHIEYSEKENARKFQNKTTKFKDANIVDIAVRDVESILKFQKSELECVSFIFEGFRLPTDTSIHTLPTKLSNMFNVSGRKIKARNFTTRTSDKVQIMSVLPFADPDTLKILNLYSLNGDKEIEMDEIAKTEQWKKAEEMNCEFRVSNLKLEDVSHFSRFSIKVPSITGRDLDFLKKNSINSSKFKYALLDFIMLNNYEGIAEWGPAFFVSGSTFRWYFRAKPSEKKILQIEFSQMLQMFVFEIIESKHVSPGAIVQDLNKN